MSHMPRCECNKVDMRAFVDVTEQWRIIASKDTMGNHGCTDGLTVAGVGILDRGASGGTVAMVAMAQYREVIMVLSAVVEAADHAEVAGEVNLGRSGDSIQRKLVGKAFKLRVIVQRNGNGTYHWRGGIVGAVVAEVVGVLEVLEIVISFREDCLHLVDAHAVWDKPHVHEGSASRLGS